ncbi:hypothetical protein MXB_5073, partial [Myxobolus squamalis]
MLKDNQLLGSKIYSGKESQKFSMAGLKKEEKGDFNRLIVSDELLTNWVLLAFKQKILDNVFDHISKHLNYYNDDALMKNHAYSSIVLGLMEGTFALFENTVNIESRKILNEESISERRPLDIFNINLTLKDKLRYKQQVGLMYSNDTTEIIFAKNNVSVLKNDQRHEGYFALFSNTTKIKQLSLIWIPNNIFHSNDSHNDGIDEINHHFDVSSSTS